MTDNDNRFVTVDDLAATAIARAIPAQAEVVAGMTQTQADIARMFGLGPPASRVVAAVGSARGTGTAAGVSAPCAVTLRREAGKARQRRWLERQHHGQAVYSVCVGCEVLDAMVRWGWLADQDVTDPHKVGKALSEMLADVAAHDRLKNR